jgi:hypothetical protein
MKNATEREWLNCRWPVQPLSSVVEKLSVGLPVSRHAVKPGVGSIALPILSVGDIEEGRITPLQYLVPSELQQGDFDRFRVRGGDILVSCRGTILKTAQVLPETNGAIASSNLIVIRPKYSVLLPQLILTVLRSPPCQDKLKSRTRSSTGLMQLTVKDLQDLPMPLPPLAMQRKLAELSDIAGDAHRRALEAASARYTLVEAFLVQALLAPGNSDA